MSIQLINAETADALLGDLQLVARQDDWSVQVVAEHDPMFWIRVEKAAGPDAIISDFKPSRLDVIDAGRALAAALLLAGYQDLNRLTFRDIDPSGQGTDVVRDMLRRACHAVAVQRRQFLGVEILTADRGKVHASFPID